jgi:hypothetical protein
LPVNENEASTISKPEPVVNEFDYLRFICDNFIANRWMDNNENGEMPLDIAKTENQVQIIMPG